MPTTFVSKENFRATDEWLTAGGAGSSPATGATAGIPGSWTPAGTVAPLSPAELIAGNPVTVVASPATAWTTGQYVQTRTAGVGGRAFWNGTAWATGAAALEGEPQTGLNLPEHPESGTVAEIQAWVEQYPHLAADVLFHEQARGDAARVTLVSWLQTFIEAHDDVPPAGV